jgi:hypothetical protein
MRMDTSLTDDIPQVTAEENHILVGQFTKEEVRKRYFRWNIIKDRDHMVSRWSFTRVSRT